MSADNNNKRVFRELDAQCARSTEQDLLERLFGDDPTVVEPDQRLLTDAHAAQLDSQGYCVIEGVLSADEAHTVLAGIEEFIQTLLPNKGLVKPPGVHGICKHEGGHLRVVWEHVRCNQRVQQAFCEYWGCAPADLLSSFDGFRYLPAHRKTQSQYAPARVLDLSGESWAHYDQTLAAAGCDPHTGAPYDNLQGSVSMSTHRGGGGFLVYPGTHVLLPKLWARYQWKDNFYVLPKEALRQLQEDAREFYPDTHPLRHSAHPVQIKPVVVYQPAGSLTLWRSVVHQSVESNSFSAEPSCVVYACMGPRSRSSARDLQKRLVAFQSNRMTSHWWHTAKLNAKAPRTYGRVVEPFGDVRHLVVNSLDELGINGRTLVCGNLK